jgi:tol-pal system protein YbgF
MRIDRRSAILLALLPLAGCYTVGPEEDPVVVKLTQLETRLAKVESTLNNESLLQLMSQLQSTQEEMRALRGELETARNDIEGLRGQQREHYLNLDKRLAALEQGTGVAPPAGDAGYAGSAGATTDAAPGGTTTGAPPPGGADAQLYDSSFELLKDGRYDEAAQGFRRLLESWPQSTYAGNSQYWLAESLYVRRDFAKALPEFQRVVESYPRSSKVGDALLKVGFCQYELQQYQDARAALERVVERYPESSAARLANERLERMRREGH